MYGKIDKNALKKEVPEERISHIIEALDEVERILKGDLPAKPTRQSVLDIISGN